MLAGERKHLFICKTMQRTVMARKSVAKLRDFRHSVFFYQSNPPRPLTNGLKPFRKWFPIRRDNRFKVGKLGLRGVNETAENEN
jgi:hypothetical protein